MFDGSTGPDGGLVYDLRAEFPSGSTYLDASRSLSLLSCRICPESTNSAKVPIIFMIHRLFGQSIKCHERFSDVKDDCHDKETIKYSLLRS